MTLQSEDMGKLVAGPLTAEMVPLLTEQSMLRHKPTGWLCPFAGTVTGGVLIQHQTHKYDAFLTNLFYVGERTEDGWIEGEWAETPVPGMDVDFYADEGRTYGTRIPADSIVPWAHVTKFRPAHSEAQPESKGHGPECWGRTSFSDEMAHCLCKPEAQPETDGGGEVKTLRTLLDNLVIAQKLSREIREHATDEARAYLYNTRSDTHPTPEGQTEGAVTDDERFGVVAANIIAAVLEYRDNKHTCTGDVAIRYTRRILAALASKGA